uniref:Uncharacterized protein n=1 Tax=Rhizophora mucronata TaxID=61149 RepID=A0A2P2PB37_RHIMU
MKCNFSFFGSGENCFSIFFDQCLMFNKHILFIGKK